MLPLIGDDFEAGPRAVRAGARISAPYADCYRCPLKLRYPDCGIACVEDDAAVIKDQTAGRVAAIIVEPMQGTAGNVIPPAGFLPGDPRASRRRTARC